MSRRLGLALALALALLAAPAQAQPCPDCLQAGAARAPLRMPAGTPLAGYGALARRLWFPDVLGRHPHAFWFAPSTGERDPLAVRALVLEGGGHRVAWVAIDLLAVDGAFTADLERRLAAAGIAPALLIVSASHTHSGPGAYVDSFVLGWLAVDRLDGAVRGALLDAAVAAVRQADTGRRPARLAAARRDAPQFVQSRLEQPLDPALVILKITGPRDEPVALVWNYAIHGTMLGARNHRLSGDVMGEASRRLELSLGVPVLFVNGAVGDVSPAGHGERAMSDLGAALAAVIQKAWSEAAPMAGAALRTGARAVALPAPWLSARNCLRGWAPESLALPLGSVFPRETTLSAVAAGDVGWVTIPGELQTSLGLGIKRAAGSHLRHPLVAGLSNDYLGYLVTGADYARPSYVSCAAVYGPETGPCLADAAAGLLAAVARGERPPAARVACDR